VYLRNASDVAAMNEVDANGFPKHPPAPGQALGHVRKYVRDSDRRGARIAIRTEGAGGAHVTDEQRLEAGCIDGQNDAIISGQALISASLVHS
jgi:hypothetical protein